MTISDYGVRSELKNKGAETRSAPTADHSLACGTCCDDLTAATTRVGFVRPVTGLEASSPYKKRIPLYCATAQSLSE